MHLLLSLVIAFQPGSDSLLTRLAGQWSGSDGDALVSRWGTPDTEEGETTYRLTSDSRMEIVDRVKSKDGTWREFGRSLVTR